MKRSFLLIIPVLLSVSCSLIKIETGSSGGSSSSSETIANKDISGTVPLAYVWGQRFSHPQRYSMAVTNLKNTIQGYSQLTPRVEQHLRLDSERLLTMPVVFIATEDAFDLTATERQNLKTYIDRGGLIILDNILAGQDNSKVEASYRKMIRDVLGSSRFEIIPDSHELFKSFFTFNGAPLGIENEGPGPGIQRTDINTRTKPISGAVRKLEGIWVNGRLAVILMNKGYTVRWNEQSTPHLKFGVNLVVFSLTQPGGIKPSN